MVLPTVVRAAVGTSHPQTPLDLAARESKVVHVDDFHIVVGDEPVGHRELY
jgi:hypothetical protein